MGTMRRRDTFDVLTSAAAAAADALAVFAGFMLAVWTRFDSGWIPMVHEGSPPRSLYIYGAALATLLFLFIFRSLGLYVRPQTGTFAEKIPRLVRAVALGILLATALAFAIRTEPPYSRLTVLLSFFTVSLLVLIERGILFHIELRLARRRQADSRVIIVGTDAVAARLKLALEEEPRLRSKVVAFLQVGETERDEMVPVELVKGSLADMDRILAEEGADQLLLADTSLRRDQMVDVILHCEKHMVDFFLVPDIFRVLTSDVEIQMVDGIPLLGLSKWPLDFFWNRVLKRIEDIIGALLGLIVSAPVIGIAALFIRRQSPGPVFYRQERCGEKGRVFTLYKLRTMYPDAEKETGPVWASPEDPRRTPIGRFLRRYNLDELPQFWNVLRGDMSLVGPRPERPHFVERFREDIGRYMWRHASRPGMTGWAQVNGLRGRTSIHERIKYDLYYLENWSLAFDFKILIMTFFAHRNAY